MFYPLKKTKNNSYRNKILIASLLGIGVILFALPRVRAFDTKKIVSLFISPTPTVIPTVIITPTPTNTPTPTPTPTATPTPSPTPIPTSIPTTSFEVYFDQYSTQYQVSKELLKKIAFCESGMNPGAKNGDYGGMYQFAESTWQATRKLMGADSNSDLRFNAKEAIETAAFKIANKGQQAWKNCL